MVTRGKTSVRRALRLGDRGAPVRAVDRDRGKRPARHPAALAVVNLEPRLRAPPANLAAARAAKSAGPNL